MDVLFNSTRPPKNQVTMVITELSSLTKPKRYDAVMAGNIKISTQILREVVDYNKKFSNSRETEPANIEVKCYSLAFFTSSVVNEQSCIGFTGLHMGAA